jgi:hypothetical protein
LNCVAPISYAKALTSSAAGFADRAFKEVTEVKQGYEDGTLIQGAVLLKRDNTEKRPCDCRVSRWHLQARKWVLS